MRWEDLVFVIILMISGEICAEDKHCDFPTVEKGRIAQYYYTFQTFYFPMSLNQKLAFSCLAGYSTENGKQEGTIWCTAEGWLPRPRCFRKCPKPDLKNGYIGNVKLFYSIKETMHYACASGFKTTGGEESEEVQCLIGGWASPPSCTKEQETCLAPELHNGNYSTTQRRFNVKDKVQYECATGFFTAGGNQTEEVECLSRGWAVTPKCTRSICPSLKLIENGYFHPVRKTYEEGDVVQFFCHVNYYLSGSDLVQCYTFGWYPEPPVCEGRRKRCPPPPLPLHSKVQAYSIGYRDGEVVAMECELTYEIQGSEELRCEDGRWTRPPRCVERERVPCGDPPGVENGYAVRVGAPRVYLSGDTMTYQCYRGFHLRGPEEISCRRGQWTPAPECVEHSGNCSPPPAVTHGAVVGEVLSSYMPGASVEYQCDQYYLLSGLETSTCQQGAWSSPPVCLEPCTVNVDNMTRNNIEMKWKYKGIFWHGDFIDFICKQGYSLSPSTLLTEIAVQCLRGQVKYPSCIRKEFEGSCASPPLIKNGVIVSPVVNTYENGSSVEYSCFEHYFLQGPREVHCVEGAWTALPLCLEPCTLSSDEMEKNNLRLRWEYDNRPVIYHGEYIEFLCMVDTFIAHSSVIGTEVRVQCEQGHLAYPKCVDSDSILKNPQ